MSIELMRIKQNQWMRNLNDTLSFHQGHLIQPLFIVEGLPDKQSIVGLKDNFRWPLEQVYQQIEQDLQSGVRQFLLFFVPATKKMQTIDFDFQAEAARNILERFGSAAQFWVDICLCSTLTTGHCCFFNEGNGAIELEKTLTELSKYSLCMAQAGVTGVAPSDMMDGRVGAIRNALDQQSYEQTMIMSYSTKFASHFYGPFRGAADSSPQFGDRKQYQLDVRDMTSALSASLRCADEGADFLMVKPGMTALDLIRPIHEMTNKPVGAYQVSGEFAGMVYLAENNFGKLNDLLQESWWVLRRGGAQFIITYGARWGREILEQK